MHYFLGIKKKKREEKLYWEKCSTGDSHWHPSENVGCLIASIELVCKPYPGLAVVTYWQWTQCLGYCTCYRNYQSKCSGLSSTLFVHGLSSLYGTANFHVLVGIWCYAQKVVWVSLIRPCTRTVVHVTRVVDWWRHKTQKLWVTLEQEAATAPLAGLPWAVIQCFSYLAAHSLIGPTHVDADTFCVHKVGCRHITCFLAHPILWTIEELFSYQICCLTPRYS